VEQLAEYARAQEVDYVVSAEARGFVIGGAVAAAAGDGFIFAGHGTSEVKGLGPVETCLLVGRKSP